jgi:hypothetical protein
MFDHHFDQIGPYGMAKEASQNTHSACDYVTIILEGKSRSDTLFCPAQAKGGASRWSRAQSQSHTIYIGRPLIFLAGLLVVRKRALLLEHGIKLLREKLICR